MSSISFIYIAFTLSKITQCNCNLSTAQNTTTIRWNRTQPQSYWALFPGIHWHCSHAMRFCEVRRALIQKVIGMRAALTKRALVARLVRAPV